MRRRLERGNSAVELALILPLLLMLTLGAVDFGRLFYAYIAVSNAAHQAATYAARPNGAGLSATGVTTLQTVISNETNGFLTFTGANANATLNLSDVTEVTGTKIVMRRIRLVHSFRPVSPIPLAGPIQVAAAAVVPVCLVTVC